MTAATLAPQSVVLCGVAFGFSRFEVTRSAPDRESLIFAAADSRQPRIDFGACRRRRDPA
jgi:hypothetical protein